MPAPDIIKQLVQRFEEQKDTYLSKNYTETPVRRDFIDPFFKALGWDIDNNEGYAETYRDVIHEDKVTVEGKSKSPDYSFRVGGVRKFFVEAKQPSVSIKNDPKPAFQLRRYGWSGKLPISILTGFAELAVYDCTIKPSEKDPASKGRISLYTYHDYVEKWDEIEGLFSKQAILKGSFDRFADKKKRGTATVDNEFLTDIEKWRQSLASNILQNNDISPRELNYAVQITIDRIIFLRICEDRGIEQYGKLERLKNSKGDLYKKLVGFFKDADDKYNSGLFHFNEKEKSTASLCDTLTLRLKIDDAPLHDILENLYFPHPYEFSVIPADILGQVYERFLGKVIHIDGKNAIIEEKPEVKKAGGVFYTPSYIVEYIVQNTVDKLLADRTPKQAEALAILDPACGSGSFLIVAYQHLLDWHLNYYLQNGGAAKFKKQLHQTQKGGWWLTTQERKRILLNNIYGVDIDSQAVEVTKLSLLLKVLEGESNESISSQFKLFHERALPDLGSNIKCGNSLIGSDFYAQGELPELTEDDHYRINVFDWKDAFPQVKEAKFDAIIGNPPYVMLEGNNRNDIVKNYLLKTYTTGDYKTDLYPVFIELSLKTLNTKGCFAFIVPSNFATNNYSVSLRKALLNTGKLSQISIFQYRVFDTASVDTCIPLVSIDKSSEFKIDYVQNNNWEVAKSALVKTAEIVKSQDAIFAMQGKNNAVLKKMRLANQLSKIAYVNFGKQLRDRKKFTEDVIHLAAHEEHKEDYAFCYTGKDVQRFSVVWNGLACKTSREAQAGGCWDDERQNTKNKLICKQIGSYPTFGIDTAGYQCLNTVFMVNVFADGVDPYFLLGILNSKPIKYFWLNTFYDHRLIFPKIKGTYLKELPIPAPPEDTKKRISNIAKELTNLTQAKINKPDSITEARIRGLNTQLDELAYQAFGLSEDERQQIETAIV